MSQWTYAACESCKESLWLEKFAGYFFPDSGLDKYGPQLKLPALSAFITRHSECESPVQMFWDSGRDGCMPGWLRQCRELKFDQLPDDWPDLKHET